MTGYCQNNPVFFKRLLVSNKEDIFLFIVLLYLNKYYQEVRLWEKIYEKIKNMPNELALMIYHTALYKKTKIGIVHKEYVSDCKYINFKGTNELYNKSKKYDFVV